MTLEVLERLFPPPMPEPALPDPLSRSFYDRPTELVARELLGCQIVRRDGGTRRVGRIVETEAYLGTKDRACHSSRGRTPRTEVMFGPPGFAYVYIIYGMYFCLNAVTRAEGEAEAVLVRAIEPIDGCLGLGSGPGLLCRALSIDKGLNGVDLVRGDGELAIFAADRPVGRVARGRRVGVDYAGGWARRLLRFWEEDSPHVSPAQGARRPRRVSGPGPQPRAMRAP